MSFQELPLKRVVSKIGSGKTPRGGSDAYVSDGVTFLRSQNVHFDGLRLDDVVRVSTETYCEMASTAVRANDVLLNITGASLGRASLAPVHLGLANVNQHVCICRPLPRRAEPRYLLYSLQSHPAQEAIWGKQNGASREGLNFEEVGRLPVFIPGGGITQQRSIADFLDRKTAAIDDLIEKKERLIELLEEKRAALINQAVTKGFDPNVPMKDSGIPWIGDIPAHWDLVAMRRIINGIDQGWSPTAFDRPMEDGEWAVIKLSAISADGFAGEFHKVLPTDEEPRPEYEIRVGDVLLTRANTPQLVGRAVYVRETPRQLLMPDLVYRLKTKRRMVDGEFLSCWLRAKSCRQQISADARGSSQSMVKISQEHIRGWLVPLPPTEEQLKISASIRDADNRHRRLVAAIGLQIERLAEYRQSLITAAVTGHLEVEAADGEAA